MIPPRAALLVLAALLSGCRCGRDERRAPAPPPPRPPTSAAPASSPPRAKASPGPAPRTSSTTAPRRGVSSPPRTDPRGAASMMDERRAANPTAAPSAASRAASAFRGMRRRGDRVDVDVFLVEIRRLMEHLAELTGTNIVCVPQIRGRATVQLRGVPADEVIATVAQALGLVAESHGRILIIRPPRFPEPGSRPKN